ncbi:response regulator [Pedobacter sp. LMG 31464]|uniref:Response regulator n=1 Tax=Pedobacter planticolens TaxID=2679964 RepID=A0A923DVH8_9SPHI|nr:response regulator [Pedobacter planticolens]
MNPYVKVIFNYKKNAVKKKRILIVEDEPISVLVIERILKPFQFELVVAIDGLDAVEKFKAEAFDLVIMDLYMPKMDGFEASKIIRSLSKTVPIIVISTAIVNEEELKRDIGIDYLLAKPLNVEKFKDFIHMLLLA